MTLCEHGCGTELDEELSKHEWKHTADGELHTPERCRDAMRALLDEARLDAKIHASRASERLDLAEAAEKRAVEAEEMMEKESRIAIGAQEAERKALMCAEWFRAALEEVAKGACRVRAACTCSAVASAALADPAPEATGTMHCWICGSDTPHTHTVEEIRPHLPCTCIGPFSNGVATPDNSHCPRHGSKGRSAPEAGKRDCNGFYNCEFCGCKTNAHLRRCCETGHAADAAKTDKEEP